ncbi:MAG: tetratricopeptide repeat protein, partial [bacterium]
LVSFVSVFLVLLFFSRGICRTEADVHFEKGVDYINQGDYQQAIEEFNRVISIDSEYVDAYCGIGIAYMNQKNYEKAVEAFEKATALDPDEPIAYYLLGRAYEEIMNYEKAISAWNKFLTLRPKGKRAKRLRKHIERLEEFK